MGSSQGTISGEEQAQESGCMDAKLQALYMHGHAQPDADAETQHTQRKKERERETMQRPAWQRLACIGTVPPASLNRR